MSHEPRHLIDYDELPSWAQGVPYVVSGYRTPGDMPAAADETPMATASGTDVRRPAAAPAQAARTYYRHDTFFKCWRSVWCYWHNETVNIHTHLWGAVTAMFVLTLQLADVLGLLPPGPWPILSMQQAPSDDVLALYAHLPLRINSERVLSQPVGVDVVMLSVFLVSTIVCLGIGIVVLIVGSHFPLLHYGFHCHPALRTAYLVHVTFWGAIAFYMVNQPKYLLPQYKGLRTIVFVALGLSGIVPLMHGLYISRSWHFVAESLGAKYVMLSGAAYIFGACLYVAHIPERWSPRTFDLLGASHQLFHMYDRR
ncbi:hypothetical protein MCAP1_000227 [Malassezia caprae]|uniref:Uncharacterized protein n=1 Tax=Malassezia caprae TaxID=1381934 RepID=A0AAF0E3R2_9BASI|nr:hypothetical protein MCAP1_000227 [Malassezia caprae]